MKFKTLVIILLAMILGSCVPLGKSVPTATAIPLPYQIINHENPNLRVDFSPFKNFGCNIFSSDRYRCEEGSLLYNLGCTYVEEMPSLGGLDPKYPIAACILQINEDSDAADIPDSCLYYNGGFITFCYRYVIYKNHSYQLVEGIDGFREFYAPIDSPDEALSFVLANGNYEAYYGQTKKKDYEYFVQTLEDTFVETVVDGYIVHVFNTYSVCAAYETKSVQVKVTYDGYLTELNKTLVYRDPTQIGCED
jgi:hypothetical protein